MKGTTSGIRLATLNLAAKVSAYAAGFLISPFTNRVLGPSGRGVLQTANNYYGLFYILCNMGIPNAFYHLFPKKKHSPATFAGNALVMGLGFGLLSIGLFTFTYYRYADVWYKNVPFTFLLIAMCWVPFHLSRLYLNTVIHCLNALKSYNAVYFFETGVTLVGTTFLLVIGKFTVLTALSLGLVNHILIFCFVLLLLFRQIRVPPHFSWSLMKDSIGVGATSYLSAIATFLLYRVDILLMNELIGVDASAKIGLYTLGVFIAETLLLVPTAVQSVLFPKVTHASQKDAEFLIVQAGKHTLLLTICGGILLILFGRLIVLIIGGKEFLPAYYPLIVLVPATICSSFCASFAPYWAKMNLFRYNSMIAGAVVILNIILNIQWIPAYEYLGAAYASLVAYAISLVCHLVLLRMTSNIRLKELVKWRLNDFAVI